MICHIETKDELSKADLLGLFWQLASCSLWSAITSSQSVTSWVIKDLKMATLALSPSHAVYLSMKLLYLTIEAAKFNRHNSKTVWNCYLLKVLSFYPHVKCLLFQGKFSDLIKCYKEHWKKTVSCLLCEKHLRITGDFLNNTSVLWNNAHWSILVEVTRLYVWNAYIF